VRVTGALDSLVSQPLGVHLLAVVREALSNCARHAKATSCVVEIEVDSEWLLLAVSDDGRGVGGEVRESGLRNLRRRAEELDGEMHVERIEPHGTRLCWRVPTRA
jgi:signal transduction histidine kinase